MTSTPTMKAECEQNNTSCVHISFFKEVVPLKHLSIEFFYLNILRADGFLKWYIPLSESSDTLVCNTLQTLFYSVLQSHGIIYKTKRLNIGIVSGDKIVILIISGSGILFSLTLTFKVEIVPFYRLSCRHTVSTNHDEELT